MRIAKADFFRNFIVFQPCLTQQAFRVLDTYVYQYLGKRLSGRLFEYTGKKTRTHS